jgi:hypothetical protein
MSRRHLFAALLLGAMAISLTSCNSGSTSSATNPVDLSPPQAPSNLRTVHDAATNRDWVLWDASASATVAEYELYSAPTSSASGTMVTTTDPNTTSFALPMSSIDNTEFYRVRAVGTNSVPSAFTSTLSVTRTAYSAPRTAPGSGRGGEGDL